MLDDELVPRPAEMPAAVRRVVERIGENCEPSLCSVLFVAGAGGSLRAGVTENPVRLTRSIKELLVNVTCGGAPVYVWPGGGITVMVDVARMPAMQLRLGADAGDRRADRVHHAPRRLPRARRPHGSRAHASSDVLAARRLARRSGAEPGNAVAAARLPASQRR